MEERAESSTKTWVNLIKKLEDKIVAMISRVVKSKTEGIIGRDTVIYHFENKWKYFQYSNGEN